MKGTDLKKSQEALRSRIDETAKKTSPAKLAFERHYRVKELAEIWKLSQSMIINLFKDEEGMLRLYNLGSRKRSYVTMSIPESVAQRVYARLSVRIENTSPATKPQPLYLGLARQKKQPVKVRELLRQKA